MSDRSCRLRIFCGPNGSGKTTVVRRLSAFESANNAFRLGPIVNADDILAELRSLAGLDTSSWPKPWSVEDITAHIQQSTQVRQSPIQAIPTLNLVHEHLVPDGPLDAYHAAAIAEWLRALLLEQRRSFTFETVMSHPSKVQFLSKARESGFRIYLYWVTTEDSFINVGRVENRAESGGHFVAPDKVRERYDRSFSLLPSAIEASDRAYLFDNSGSEGPQWVAEWDRARGCLERRGSGPGPHWLSSPNLTRLWCSPSGPA